MKIIQNRIIPFGKFTAINLFGVFFVKTGVKVDGRLLNHEAIHTAQMRELGYIFFYIFYLLEWIFRLLRRGNAYRQLSFEREAYDNESDMSYLKKRRPYSQWRLRR